MMVHENSRSKEEKVTRRLARKAELARQSRRRKKAYVSSLEDKIEELTAKVLELQGLEEDISSNPVALALCAMTELQQSGNLGVRLTKTDNDRHYEKLETESSDSASTPVQQSPSSPARYNIIRRVQINHNGDTRTLSLGQEDFTYWQLEALICDEFSPEGSRSFNMKAWYIDDEEDEILITTTPELLEAWRVATAMAARKMGRENINQRDPILLQIKIKLDPKGSKDEKNVDGIDSPLSSTSSKTQNFRGPTEMKLDTIRKGHSFHGSAMDGIFEIANAAEFFAMSQPPKRRRVRYS